MSNTLGLTNLQFLALNEILRYVCLGDQTIYSEEISDMLIAWEQQGLDEYLVDLEHDAKAAGIGKPVVRFEYSEDDGMVINVDEE